jgi:hypothetical protein
VHQVGNQPRLCYDARSTNHQDIPFYLNTVLHFNQKISPGQRHKYLFRNKNSFYGEEFLAPRPNLKLKDHPLSAVFDCLFNIFAATFHTGGRSSVRKLRTDPTVVTGIEEVFTGFW